MSTAVVAGRPLATRDICGVLTRLPWVVEQDLDFIVPADRAYVAAEMMAYFAILVVGTAMSNTEPTRAKLAFGTVLAT